MTATATQNPTAVQTATQKIETKGEKTMKPTREQIVELAKEMNAIGNLKINVSNRTATEAITAQIENSTALFTAAEFGESVDGSVVFSESAKATYTALGHKFPKVKATKTAEQVAADKKNKPAPAHKEKYTRAHAFMDVLRKGATKQELTEKAATLYESKGGKHNATSAEWYTIEYLKILTLAGVVSCNDKGKYNLTK